MVEIPWSELNNRGLDTFRCEHDETSDKRLLAWIDANTKHNRDLQVAILRLRLKATSQLNWRKGEEHPRTFKHGETMLVVVELGDTDYLIDLVAVSRREDGNFDFMADGVPWQWEWSDASFWIPIAELEATLPKPTEASP